jgi:cytochrome c peroxidase
MSVTTRLAVLSIAVAAVVTVSCRRENPSNPANESDMVPALPEKTVDYPQSQNDNLATLGRVLFYDKQLSLHNNLSCGSCHQQQYAFSDNKATSEGTDGIRGKRNTPIVFPKSSKLFWDGRANSLNDMVLRPVEEPVEMNQTLERVVTKIRNLDYYKRLFAIAFPAVAQPDTTHIRAAIAEFVKNFGLSNTKFVRADKGQDQLTAEENLGKDLFFGKAKCSNCHQLNPNAVNAYYSSGTVHHNIGLDEVYSDNGVGAITHNDADNGAFMMPILLNIEYTAPYMHDGRFATLEEVIEHYNSKVKNHPNLDRFLKDYNGQPIRLHLTDAEKASLVSFLKTLSDPSLLTDPKFSDPFIPRPRS